MKGFIWLPLLFFILAPGIGCKEESGNKNANHTTHQKAETSGMENMDMQVSNAQDSMLASVVAAANKLVISDQLSIPVRVVDTIIGIKGYGYVSWDVRRNKKIAARTGGRVERLFVKYNNQYVSKGQKILELYTPEINTYASEYLHHIRTPGDETLRVKAKEKLLLLGVTSGQITALETTGTISNNLSVYSNSSGYALFEPGSNTMTPGMNDNDLASAGGMGGGMNSTVGFGQERYAGINPQMQLKEGMYINKGQTLFYVNDFAVAWGILSFDASMQSFLRAGMNVTIKSELSDRPIRSDISFIEPSFNNANQKFMQVRTYLPNSNARLKVNSLIEGTLDIPLRQQIIIPAASIFSLGKRMIVWVKTGSTPSGKNIFKARDIRVSLMDKAIAVVASGLSSTEEVAADAGYLLDSQSLIEQ